MVVTSKLIAKAIFLNWNKIILEDFCCCCLFYFSCWPKEHSITQCSYLKLYSVYGIERKKLQAGEKVVFFSVFFSLSREMELNWIAGKILSL